MSFDTTIREGTYDCVCHVQRVRTRATRAAWVKLEAKCVSLDSEAGVGFRGRGCGSSLGLDSWFGLWS